MAICPAGHTSTADDYCDICGLPVVAAGAATATTVTQQVVPAGAVCPNCDTTNAPDALFCEACGYDFTTGTMPRSAAPRSAWEPSENAATADHTDPGQPHPVIPANAAISTADEHRSSQGDPQPPQGTQADPTPEQPHPASGQPDPVIPANSAISTAGDPVQNDHTASFADLAADLAPDTGAAGPPAEGGLAEPRPTPPSRRPLQTRPASVEWVAEVWIDPDWYATQGSTDQLPSPGLPDVVPLRANSALIGRTSRSRNIHPDIDCELDSGVSRRHAQVTSDGSRWWIEDLESANGTFLGPSAGPLPTEPVGRGRVEFAPDQRIYLGAWTRIVIRSATDDEKQAFNA